MIKERAMSPDGYVKDQDYTDDILYGVYPSSYNGCGWIASYNMLHALSLADNPEEQFARMVEILPYKGRRGTPFPTLWQFFRRAGLPVSRHYGTAQILLKYKDAPCGILRYAEEGVPHYITFVRTGPGRYRFFNVADGLEDFETDMETFIRERVTNRKLLVRLLIPGKR